MRNAFLILFFLNFYFCVLAQQPRRPSSKFPGSGGGETSSYPNTSNPINPNGQNIDLEEPDTAKVRYFFAQNPDNQYVWSDTSLSNHFQQYLPTRKRYDEYTSLGYAGSAAKPIVWQGTQRQGFDLGIKAFDPYFFHHKDFKYYLNDRAFSQGKWSFRSLGNDNNLDFEYGNHFKKGVFLSLNWHRLNTSTEGAYKFANQNALNTNWGLSVGQIKQRYQWFCGFTNNSFKHGDNGGISKDIGLINSDSLPFSGGLKFIPTKARTAVNLTFIQRDIQWRHAYKLNSKDSTSRNFRLIHQLNYRTTNFKSYSNFNGQAQKQDSLFFGNLLKYTKGARLFINLQNIENQFIVAFNSFKNKGTNRFELGLKHSWYRADLEKNVERVQNLFAFSQIDFNSFERFKLRTSAHLGLAEANAGEYRAEGVVFFDLKPIGNLEGRLVQQRYQPTLMERKLYNAQQVIWDNDFKKIFETNFSAIYRLPKFGFSVEVAYHLINNYIYFNKNLILTQRGAGLNIFQLNLSESIRLKHFGLDNFVSFQQTDASSLHLPKLTGKHSLYVEGRILRKKIMLARLGLDLRYTTDYQADSYHPFLAQFYWQDAVTVPFYPSIDAFLSAKVDKTRVFVKFENLTRSFYRSKIFYTVPFYPMYDSYWRIGIQRKFID